MTRARLRARLDQFAAGGRVFTRYEDARAYAVKHGVTLAYRRADGLTVHTTPTERSTT